MDLQEKQKKSSQKHQSIHYKSNSCNNITAFQYRKEKITRYFEELLNKNDDGKYKQQQRKGYPQLTAAQKPTNQSYTDTQERNFQKVENLQKMEEVKDNIIIVDEDWQMDGLQIEALNYQLSQFGLPRSQILSLAPIVAYYCYSILTNNESWKQFPDRDCQLKEFVGIYLQNDNLIGRLKQQIFTYVEKNREQYYCIDFYEYFTIAPLIPKNVSFQELDVDVLIDDYLKFSNLYIEQKEKFIKYLELSNNYTKNNAAIAHLRFVFQNIKANSTINYRIPISEFDNVQFLDSNEINKIYNFQVSSDIANFLGSNHFHSEKNIIHFIILDSLQRKMIFNQLRQKLVSDGVNQKELTLMQLQIEITSERRQCNLCVQMFNKTPISFYCKQLLENFNFNIAEKFYLMILSQYFSDAQYHREYKLESSNEPMFSIIQQDVFNKNQLVMKPINRKTRWESSPQFLEKSENSKFEQESIQNRTQRNNTQYFIVLYELPPTGLLSNQLFYQRYLLKGNQCCKTPINNIILSNTVFFSTYKQDGSLSSQSSLYSNNSSQDLSFIFIFPKNNFIHVLDTFKSELAATKIFQQQNHQEIEQHQEQLKSIDQVFEELKLQFICTIIRSHVKWAQEKGISAIEMEQFSEKIVIPLIFLQPNQEWYVHKIFQYGILFNREFNRQLLLKDYLFIKQYIECLDGKFQKWNQVSFKNQLSVLLLSIYEKTFVEKIKLDLDDQFSNCVQFSQILKRIILQLCLHKNVEYHLIILSWDKIYNMCIPTLVEQLYDDDLQAQNINIRIEFISFNFKDHYKNYQFPQNLKQRRSKTFSIYTQNYNFFNFIRERYKNENQSTPFSDISEFFTLHEYDCETHNGGMKRI